MKCFRIKRGASFRFLEPLVTYNSNSGALLNAVPIVYLVSGQGNLSEAEQNFIIYKILSRTITFN